MQRDKHDKHEGTVIKRAGRRHHDDEHGGAWKVAFADFCLALMALFLVLWLMATREQQALQKSVRDASNGMLEGQGGKPAVASGQSGSLIERFEMPRTGSGKGTDGSTGATAARVNYDSPSELAKLSHALEKMSVDAGLSSNLAAVLTPHGLRVMLHDTDRQGMFMRGSALPTVRFSNLLRKMGPLFAQMENQMLVVGHTDSLQYTQTGSHGGFSNWTLSSMRAMAARDKLLEGGMRSDSVLQVVGMAERAPLDAAHATASVNRRIELLILTRSQAASVAAMFGMPGPTKPLAPGASTTVTGAKTDDRADAGALAELRQKLAK